MKLILSLLLIFASFSFSYSQFGTEQIVNDPNEFDQVTSVYAADLDGDGYTDILSTSQGNDEVVWYKNINNSGTFGSKQVISSNTDSPTSVYTADLDGDGDIDVLSASGVDDKIAWYENMDGQGNFGSQQIITTNANIAEAVYAADIDGDGDMDVLSASGLNDTVAWYENIDGQGTFGALQIINSNTDYATSVYATDLDGDGDTDVLSASFYDNKIAWYENTDGQGTFSSEIIIDGTSEGAKFVYASDIDGDGDMDVVSASQEDSQVAWHENIDGKGNFSTKQIISSNVPGASSVYAIDIDGDGDMDVLSSSSYDHTIAWHENLNGLGTFEEQKIISNNAIDARRVYAADFDGDGDMDVLSASYLDSKIAWYENLRPLSISENKQITVSIFPNPAINIVNINSSFDIRQIEVYDLLGKKIIINVGNNKIDISTLSNGLYLLKIIGKDNNHLVKKITKG